MRSARPVRGHGHGWDARLPLMFLQLTEEVMEEEVKGQVHRGSIAVPRSPFGTEQRTCCKNACTRWCPTGPEVQAEQPGEEHLQASL